ncbi:MAG: host specificity factor TipJ family phage tail protein [Bacilli bacterium]
MGQPINEPIKNVKPHSSINGQVLDAPNASKIKGSNNIRFVDDGSIECATDIDFTDYFTPSTVTNPRYVVISGSSYNGTYEIKDVEQQKMTLVDPATVNAAWSSLSGATAYGSPTLVRSNQNWSGIFAVIDTTTTELWCNFVAPGGLYKVDSQGNQHAVTVSVQVEVTSIDSSYNPQGSPIYYQTTLKGSEVLRSQAGATLKLTLPFAGACQVRARRLTSTDLRDGWQVVDEVQWRDLYVVSPVWDDDVLAADRHFGNVTTIQTVTWPTPRALSLKQRKINVMVGRILTLKDETVVVPATAAPWTFEDGKNAAYPFGFPEFDDPVSYDVEVLQGTQIAIEYLSGTVSMWPGYYEYTDAAGLPTYITGDTQDGGRYWPTHYTTDKTLGGGGLIGCFTDAEGNVIQPIAIGNYGEFTVPSGASKLQLGINDTNYYDYSGGVPNDGSFTVKVTHAQTGAGGYSNAADILCAMALDPYIGRMQESEIDTDAIRSILGPGGEVETYFGTSLCAEFSYAFDDRNLSFEEMVGQLMQAVFCTAFRRGNVLSVAFEKQRADSMLLFNHRNKLPGSENRTITFGAVTQNDGIELSYVEPYAPNAQNVDSQYTLYFPEDQSAVAPKKIDAAGVRNRVQAWMLGWRLYQKLLYQNEVTQFDATSEAALCIIGDRILVADNTRSGVQDGEVLAQNGLELTLSQPVDIGAELSPAPSYSIFLQLYDGSVESIPISAGSTDRKVILSEAPSLPLVLDEAKYARTTYMIVSEAEEDRAAFLVQEKDAKKGGIYGIKAVNYDDRYYAHDQDYNASPRIIDVIAPGEGAGAGYDKRASVGVNVDGRCRPWIAADNASFDYGIASGLPPVAVPIQSAQGDSVFINAAAPGSPSSFSMWGMPLFMTPNTVSRNDDADNAVDAEGEDDFITGQQTSEVDGYGQKRFPTYYATSPELGRSGLIGAWAIKDSPSAGKYEVVQPIAIGFGGEFIVPAGGVDTLLLGINDNKHSDNRGAFEVQVTQTGEAAGDAAAEDPVPDTTTTDPYGTTYTIQINGA